MTDKGVICKRFSDIGEASMYLNTIHPICTFGQQLQDIVHKGYFDFERVIEISFQTSTFAMILGSIQYKGASGYNEKMNIQISIEITKYPEMPLDVKLLDNHLFDDNKCPGNILFNTHFRHVQTHLLMKENTEPLISILDNLINVLSKYMPLLYPKEYNSSNKYALKPYSCSFYLNTKNYKYISLRMYESITIKEEDIYEFTLKGENFITKPLKSIDSYEDYLYRDYQLNSTINADIHFHVPQGFTILPSGKLGFVYYNLETLYDIYAKHDITFNEKVYTSLSILEALKKLHSEHHMVHRLLTPSCVFFSTNTVLLGDFSYCCPIGSELTKIPSGLQSQCPPEVKAGFPYTEKSDLYALGNLFHFIFTGILATDYIKYPSINFEVIDNSVVPRGISNDLMPSIRILIKRCFETNPEDRLSIDQIYSEFNTINSLIHR